ncbi:MAG: hypothetical protein M1815_000325 [Lichina confinis]|nr:MAG: hypothetical protein M1815_000325 [Lichina confinis]
MQLTISMALFIGLATALPTILPARAKGQSAPLPGEFILPVGFCDEKANANDFRCLDTSTPTLPGGAGGPSRTPESRFKCETSCLDKTQTPDATSAVRILALGLVPP